MHEARWETRTGERIESVAGFDVPAGAVLVLSLVRRWSPRCGQCMTIVTGRTHERRKTRRWEDLPWAGRRARIEYAPVRVKCPRCGAHATDRLPWAEPKQRQTTRLQHHLALDAYSMPLSHVATKYGLAWRTVRRAEADALARWERSRPPK